MSLCDEMGKPCLRGKKHTGACKWPSNGPLTANKLTEPKELAVNKLTIAHEERITALESQVLTLTELTDSLQLTVNALTADPLTVNKANRNAYMKDYMAKRRKRLRET